MNNSSFSLIHTDSNDAAFMTSATFELCRVIIDVLCLLSVVLNLSAILAVTLGVSDKRPIHKFLVSLSISEILYSILTLIQNYIFLETVHATTFSLIVLVQFHLVLLAVDQYTAVCKPLYHIAYFSPVRSNRMVACIWMIYVIIWIICVLQSLLRNQTAQFSNLFMILDAVLLNLVCLILLFLNSKIILEIRKIGIQPTQGFASRNINRKGVSTVFLIFLTYSLFHMPYICAGIVSIVKPSQYASLLVYLFFTVLNLNLVCDPLIYSFRMREVRKGYRVAFNRIKNVSN